MISYFALKYLLLTLNRFHTFKTTFVDMNSTSTERKLLSLNMPRTVIKVPDTLIYTVDLVLKSLKETKIANSATNDHSD